MNTELRNKILNRYKESAEQENTQELEAMKQAREQVDLIYPSTFELARQVVERSYPSEDVKTCRTLKMFQNILTLVYMEILTMVIMVVMRVAKSLLMLIIVMS